MKIPQLTRAVNCGVGWLAPLPGYRHQRLAGWTEAIAALVAQRRSCQHRVADGDISGPI
jgi:hypothetical protein